MLNRSSLNLHILENLPSLSSPKVSLTQRNTTNDFIVSASSEETAHMSLNKSGLLVEDNKLAVLARQIATATRLQLNYRHSHVEVGAAGNERAPRRLDANGGARLPFEFEEAACEHASSVRLYEECGSLHFDVLGAS